MSITIENGRLGNQIIRNLAVSKIAAKHNLHVTYSSYDRMIAFGLQLECGTNKYDETRDLTDDNYFDVLNSVEFPYNVEANNSYFQTGEIMQEIRAEITRQRPRIEAANPYSHHYGTNNDCFMHVRLTDAARHNPGFQYYADVLARLSFDNLYVATDNPYDPLIQQIKDLYPQKTHLYLSNEVDTIKFGSTCRHVVLSHGSFSAVIGYLAFCSNIYYSSFEGLESWHGDMFSVTGWTCMPRKGDD